ncbi:hypothetical protein F4861DRAFT_543080 [Xylaria intraflava]|nr:hypothetical protein F4861DRAFT_543080 [Xylaria intraflava]
MYQAYETYSLGSYHVSDSSAFNPALADSDPDEGDHIASTGQAVWDNSFLSLNSTDLHSMPLLLSTAASPTPWDHSAALTGAPATHSSISQAYGQHGPPPTPTQVSPGINLSASQCDICSRWFSLEKDLRRHKSSVHRQPSDPAFRCRCGHEDSRKDNYKRHLRKCKKELVNPYYACKCCSHECMAKGEHEKHIQECKAYRIVWLPWLFSAALNNQAEWLSVG